MRHRLRLRLSANRPRTAHRHGNGHADVIKNFEDIVGHMLHRAVSGYGRYPLYGNFFRMRERKQYREHVVMPRIAVDENLHVGRYPFLLLRYVETEKRIMPNRTPTYGMILMSSLGRS